MVACNILAINSTLTLIIGIAEKLLNNSTLTLIGYGRYYASQAGVGDADRARELKHPLPRNAAALGAAGIQPVAATLAVDRELAQVAQRLALRRYTSRSAIQEVARAPARWMLK